MRVVYVGLTVSVIVLLGLGVLMAAIEMQRSRTKPAAKNVEAVVPAMKFPETKPLTIEDLPVGWTVYQNQNRFRLKDPQGKKRLPLVFWFGILREFEMDFTSVDEAVSSALEHQRRDDFAKEENWKPVQSTLSQ